ncbi:MAG TPA: globin domain-containing protein [Pilimelia sp.]|nr:globin domain-containing protein [Pilimelia sp.]
MPDDPTITRDHFLLQESLALVAPVADELIASFYDRLFTARPELRPMFAPDLTPQRERLLTAVIALVTQFDRPEQLQPVLAAMGRAHVRYGVRLDHYAAVGSALLATLAEYAGPAWNPAYAAAWERLYTYAAGTMMAAACLVSTTSGNGLRHAA